jgi:hypothetical protein
MTLELHLRIVGVLLLALTAMNLCIVPRRFGWKQEMARLSLLNRQIFQVHAGFICLVLVMMAALLLLYTEALLEGTPLSRAVLLGLGGFWFVRLLTQWLVYSPRVWRGHRFNTVMHGVFTGLWLYFTGVFAWAVWG